MIKRIFLLFFGLGLGLLVGAFVVRKMDEASQAVAPTNVARNAGRAAGGFLNRLRDAAEETARVAAIREAELRAEFDVPTVREALQRD
jgi:hypothetical protein